MKKLLVVVPVLFLAACGLNEEEKAMKRAYLEACKQGNQGACDVIIADTLARGGAAAAAQANWTAATGNTANWAVQQQHVPTYSGGGNRCSTNTVTGQQTCY